MEKITRFIEEKMAPPLIRLSEMRYLQVVQRTFMTTMPILLFSSLLILIAALPIPGWSNIVAPISWKSYGLGQLIVGAFGCMYFYSSRVFLR